MKKDKFKLESYSQLGEDLNIDRLLRARFNKNENVTGFYVDVGAFHPYKFSNTYKFYERGWKGINIEPNPETFHLLEKFRPDDINLNIGISSRQAKLQYWKYNRGAFNTFSKSEVLKLESLPNLELKEVLQIQTKPLNMVLEEYCNEFSEIDFLSVDVEGLDFEVLSSIDLARWKPKIICVEENMLLHRSFNKSKIYKLLIKAGYELKCIVAKSNIYIWNPGKTKKESNWLLSFFNRIRSKF